MHLRIWRAFSGGGGGSRRSSNGRHHIYDHQSLEVSNCKKDASSKGIQWYQHSCPGLVGASANGNHCPMIVPPTRAFNVMHTLSRGLRWMYRYMLQGLSIIKAPFASQSTGTNVLISSHMVRSSTLVCDSCRKIASCST